MNRSRRYAAGMVALGCFVLLMAAVPGEVGGAEITYDGTFAIAHNGDMAVTVKLTLPMLQYQKLRDNISNLYLMLRNLASERANTEVVDKKADWDDANRTITFSMTVLGAARNLGNRWEVDVAKGAMFSNLDEAKKTLFFSEAGKGTLGPIRGTSKLILPDVAEDFKWDSSRRVASYCMPPVKGGAGGSGLWIAAIVVLILGAVVTGASFVVKPALGTA